METTSENTAQSPSPERRFHVPGDVVARATADLPDEQCLAIRWLHAHAAEKDLTLAELAKLIRYDETTVWRVLNGKYEGNLGNVCAQISAYRQLWEQRNLGRKLGFISTTLSHRIWQICDAALEFQRIAYIFGESQIGKTIGLQAYRDRRGPGSVIYVRMPTGGGLTTFLKTLAAVLRISPSLREYDLRARVIGSFDDRTLLIVDEAHQCFLSKGELRAVRTIEFIREIHDIAECGVVICGTNVFREQMETGPAAGFLKQSRLRRLAILQLPSVPPAKDLDTFAAAYGLAPASGEAAKLQAAVLAEEGLGIWLVLLRIAGRIAAKRKTELAWEHVLAAWAQLHKQEEL
jgi:DNA transposition AAA+ family ATPase